MQRHNVNEALPAQKTKVISVVLGLLVLLIPVVIGVLVISPELRQMLLQSRTDIAQGIIVGMGALPVFLFIGIKLGESWYKKIWAWILILAACVVVLGLTLYIQSDTSYTPMAHNTYIEY